MPNVSGGAALTLISALVEKSGNLPVEQSVSYHSRFQDAGCDLLWTHCIYNPHAEHETAQEGDYFFVHFGLVIFVKLICT